MVVPYGAGGVTDILARVLADGMSAEWGQAVIVEAKPGGNTFIGTEYVLNSPADGYTMLMVAQSHAANAAVYPDLRWDPARDFTGAGLFARTVPYFVVPIELPVKDMAEFIALAKSKPGKLNYGHAGLGSPPHLSFELFKRTAGVDLLGVPYKGNAAIMADLLSGRISAAMMSAVSTTGQAKAGKIRQLVVMDGKRSKDFPDVPSIAEAGFPQAQTQSWFGVVMHSKTPADILKRVTDQIEKVASTPGMAERLEKIGAELSFMNSQDFNALIRKDIATWTKVVKEAGIKPQ